jgi:hypothetical protein
VPGLYLAGDASRDVQFIVVAAAEGARAGVAINADLQADSTAAALSDQRNPPGRSVTSGWTNRSGTPPSYPQPRSGG